MPAPVVQFRAECCQVNVLGDQHFDARPRPLTLDKPPILSGTLSRPDVVHTANSTTCRLRQSATIRNLVVLPFVAYHRTTAFRLVATSGHECMMNFPICRTGRKLRRVTRCTTRRCYLLRRLDTGTDWNEGKIAITDNVGRV